jgi:hypothetical protein
MDDFIASILTLFDSINETKEKLKKTIKGQLINNYVIEKQFLAYYIYRIWIKYRKLMEYINTTSEFNKVLMYLNIPPKYYKYNVTFPMQDKMINNEKQLDLVILNILKHFNKTAEYFEKVMNKELSSSNANNNKTNKTENTYIPKNETITPNGQYKQLNLLLESKSLQMIVTDIAMLKVLVPNLSKPSGRISLWEKVSPYIDKVELDNNNNLDLLNLSKATVTSSNTSNANIGNVNNVNDNNKNVNNVNDNNKNNNN